jgi:ATP-dependent DNA ligase
MVDPTSARGRTATKRGTGAERASSASNHPLSQATAMEAQSADRLPIEPGWWYEPKWDGFRCLAFRDGETVILQAKSGKPLTRYFPKVAQRLAAIPEPSFAIDGELLIPVGKTFSFEALQMRLHPPRAAFAA